MVGAYFLQALAWISWILFFSRGMILEEYWDWFVAVFVGVIFLASSISSWICFIWNIEKEDTKEEEKKEEYSKEEKYMVDFINCDNNKRCLVVMEGSIQDWINGFKDDTILSIKRG